MDITFDPILNKLRQKDSADLSGITTADIAESTNKKYITDAEEIAIGTIASKAPIANATLTGTTGVDRVQMNVSATPATNAEGLLQWNATDGTLDLGMGGGTIAQQVGQELFIKVINKTASTISNGSPVYFIGRLGNRPKIELARSDVQSTAMVMGVTTQDIIADAEGFITTFGYVRQIKTNYSGAGNWGTTWDEGDKLYLSKTVAGQLTNVEPAVPHHSDIIGCVGIIGGAGVGSILININRHYTLQELSDVNGTPLATDGQIPVWHNSTALFDFDKNINDYVPRTLLTTTKEATGFFEPENVIITGNSTDKKVTLTGTVEAYWRGAVIPSLVSGYISPAHGTDTSKQYYLYYNGSTIAWYDSVWTFDKLQIASAFYDATLSSWIYCRECHGFMPPDCHESDHFNKGAYKHNGGGDLDSYTIGSTTTGNRRPTVSQLTHHDEDLETVQAALTNDLYNIMKLGTAAAVLFAVDQADIVPLSTANPYYNSFSTPNWGQTLMPSNSVMSVWLISIPTTADVTSQKFRYVWLQGQWITQASGSSAGQLSTALTAELAKSFAGINLSTLSSLSPEFLPIQRITITYTSSNWYISSVSVLSGSRYQQTQSPAGGFLSSVSVDGTTITGNGTAGTPLSVNQFASTFTSSNSTGFAWTDNTLAITHGLGVQYVDVLIFDNNGVKVDYTVTATSTSVATVSFPIGAIPITGTYNVRIR